MASKKQQDAIARKRQAVVTRLREMHDSIEILAGMWDERTLDTLVLILGVGRVELDDDN